MGLALREAPPAGFQVVAPPRAELDLADAGSVHRWVGDRPWAAIINAGAWTAVDAAETHASEAWAANALGPALLARAAAERGLPLVQISTDYVFDGGKTSPYTESDAPNPQNLYGASKWAGEQALAAANPQHLILRTSWVVGAHGANFAKTMLRLAAEREQLTVVADQFGAPTSAALLADLTAQLLRQYQREGAAGFPFGTYHVASAGETTWCDYARFVIGEAFAAGKTLKARPENVLPIATADYPTPARRPANSRLDTRHFRETFGLRLPPWQEGLRHILQQIL